MSITKTSPRPRRQPSGFASRGCGLTLLGLALLTGPSRAQTWIRHFDAPIALDNSGSPTCILDSTGDGYPDVLRLEFSGSGLWLRTFQGDTSGWFADWGMWPLPVQTAAPSGSSTPRHEVERARLDSDLFEDAVMAIGTQVIGSTLPAPWVLPVMWAWTAPAEFRDLEVGDIDGNGIDDAVVLLADSTIAVLFGGLVGGAPSPSFVTSFSGVTEIALADIDGNGFDDLVFGTLSGTVVGASIAGAVPTVLFTATYTNADVRGIFVRDFDNDADLDLRVVAATSLPGGQPGYATALLRRSGTASFVAEPLQYLPAELGLSGGLSDVDMAAGDADGDGFPELAVRGPLRTWVFAGSATALLAGRGLGETFGPGRLHLADVDGDGLSDLVVGDTLVFGRAGRGWFPESGPGIELEGPAVDLDTDGDPDLDLGRGGTTSSSGSVFAGPSVNDGTGRFTAAQDPLPAPPSGSVYLGPGYVGDFDGDGAVDVLANVVGASSAPSASRLLRNLGGGAFVDAGPVTPPGVSLGAFPFYDPTRLVPASALSGLPADIDGDGDLDLVARDRGVPNSIPCVSRLWLNVGAGGFVAGGVFPTFYAQAVADVTTDGIPDLVGMSTALSGAAPHRITVIPGIGGGMFADQLLATVLATTVLPTSRVDVRCVAVFDIDINGQPRILGALAGTTPSVHRRTPSGTWVTSPLGGLVSGENGFIDLVDCDADGRRDFVVAADTRTRVYLGNATGFGYRPRSYSVATPIVTDLDADGDPELLTRDALFRGDAFGPQVSGRRLQLLSGLAGSGGLVPILGAAGAVRPAGALALRLSNALGGASGVLAIGTNTAATPLFGGTLHLAPLAYVPFTLGGAPGIAGAGRFALPIPPPASLIGFSFLLQSGVADPGAVQGVALSNALSLTIGP